MEENRPSFKPNKGARFYNPGDRISEAIIFSLPGQVTRDSGNLMANWLLDAPALSFFQVPTQIHLYQDNTRLNVDFPATVLQRFADRGVIMIDDEWEPGDDEDRAERMPFAKTDEAARTKGDAKWIKYLQSIVKNHINACDRARAAGGFPLEAQGFTKRALKLLNMQDPAAMVFDSLKKQAAPDAPPQVQSEEAAQLRRELDATNARLQKVLDRLEAKERLEDSAAIDEQASAAARSKRKTA